MLDKNIQNTIYNAKNGKYFVSVRINNRTKFGGTFYTRTEAIRASKQLLQSQKIKNPLKVVCMY